MPFNFGIKFADDGCKFSVDEAIARYIDVDPYPDDLSCC